MKERGAERTFTFVVSHSVTSDIRLPTFEIVVISRTPMLTQKPFTAWCVMGVAQLGQKIKKKNVLSFPSTSRSDNSRQSKNISIFFHNHLSSAYSQGRSLFTIQSYCFTDLFRVKVATSSSSLLICPHSSVYCEQVKRELEAVQSPRNRQ